MTSRWTFATPLLAWLACIAAGAAAAAHEDEQFLQGLRQRRLFTVAEAYCRDELQQQPSPRRAADLTIELIRTLAQHAAYVDPPQRAALWEQARSAGAALPDNPRRFLLETQVALAELARAELARQEIAVRSDAAARERALDAIRRAERLLEQIDKQLTVEIPRRRRTPPRDPDKLTADELFSLQSHVQLHLVTALRTRGRCYPPGSDDRAAALHGALQWSERPLAQLSPDEPLAQRIRLEQAACRRLLGDLPAAQQALDALARSGNVTPAVGRELSVERARLQLDAGRFENALAALEDLPFGADAETDLVRMRASLGLLADAKRARDQEAERQAREAAVELAEQIRTRHGPYWGRRADQLLVAVAGGASGDLDILRRQADALFLAGELKQAARVYDLAADKAFEQDDQQTAFTLAYKSALVAGRQGDLLRQSGRLRQLAVRLPRHPQSAAAHEQAALLIAQLARQDESLLDDYQRLLQEQLRLWPSRAGAGRVRLWLARLQQQRGQYQEAADTYLSVPADSEQATEAIRGAEACQLAVLRSLPADEAEAAAQQAARRLESLVLVDGRLPSAWTPPQRAAALAAARLWLQGVRNSHRRAESLVSGAIAGPPPAPAETLQRARPLLVVALAGQADKLDEAEQVLQQLGEASPEQLLETLRGLSEAARAAPPASQARLAALQLNTIRGLLAKPSLDDSLRRRIERTRAAALASAGRAAEAAEAYAALARQHPRDGALQAEYARFLSQQNDAALIEKSLQQWRVVAAGARAQSDLWYEAKYQVALALYRQGKKQQAAERLQYVQAVSGLDDTRWKNSYLSLLQKCR